MAGISTRQALPTMKASGKGKLLKVICNECTTPTGGSHSILMCEVVTIIYTRSLTSISNDSNDF